MSSTVELARDIGKDGMVSVSESVGISGPAINKKKKLQGRKFRNVGGGNVDKTVVTISNVFNLSTVRWNKVCCFSHDHQNLKNSTFFLFTFNALFLSCYEILLFYTKGSFSWLLVKDAWF